MDKIEIVSDRSEDKGKTKKIIKHLSLDKTKIPLTEDEYNFLKNELNKHIKEYGITYGFIYNLILKDLEEDGNDE